MARHKEFDPAVALAKAVQLFRQRGFEATSTTALVKHMGIGRGSLYETFGTKGEIFGEVLRTYEHQAFGGMIRQLESSNDPVTIIREIFESLGRNHASGRNPYGCLMVNTTIEAAIHTDEITDVLRAAWKRLEDSFTRSLVRGQKQGKLSESKDPRAIARFLITIMRGMGVGTKLGTSRAVTADIVSLALGVLD